VKPITINKALSIIITTSKWIPAQYWLRPDIGPIEERPCDPIPAMKIALGLAALIFFIALSLFADYKWKQWMAARKQDRNQ
jgi:hypothetical protein